MSIAVERPWTKMYGSVVDPDLRAPRETTLDLFDASVTSAPDHPSLHYFGRTLSRQEVSALSIQFAHVFANEGVGSGDRVAISLQNTPVFVLTVLGAWRLGAVVVPINPMLRSGELGPMLRDSRAKLMLAHPEMRQVIEAVRTKLPQQLVALWSHPAELAGGMPLPFTSLDLDFDETVLDKARAKSTMPGAWRTPSSADIALLTYTSGTTGPSKGAMNTHANLGYQAVSYAQWFGLTDQDSVLAMAPLFHITGLGAHVALALGKGLPLVLTHRFEPKTVLGLIEKYEPAFTIGAITAFIALQESSRGAEPLTRMKTVFSGGAAVPASVVERYEELTGTYIHNMYGLTESTSACIGVPRGRRAPVHKASGALSIGLPMSGVQVTIVGEDGKPAPRGVEGEMVIQGPQVCAGYWEKAAETANAFAADGLHTGDVGIMDEDGWIYVVDRMKDLVVVSGYKVWPRDVEDALYLHPAVREVAVVGKPDPYRGETLHAYVSLRANTTATVEELKAVCRDRLSAYKCPTEFHFVDDLPKTATGKILRRTLRD